MKKLLLFPLLVMLSSCSSSSPQNNENSVLEPLPAFLEMNTNSIFDPTSLNANTALRSNENMNAIADNNNENGLILVAAPTDLNLDLLTPHEVAFDCQPLSVYEEMPFYESFISDFESLFRYSTTDMKYMIARAPADADTKTMSQQATSKENRDNISSSCLAQDGSVFIVISEEESGGYGFKIIRYQLERRLLEVASRDDEQHGSLWPITPSSFGRRSGTTLTLSASGKTDAGASTMSYEYNYVTNHITVSKICTAGVCTPYAY